ncbi:MAG: GxxExxY protein [Verrucomicrobia bacterium]|nr:GxxExxY protein [Verrucomicrobiota bacterium]
MEEDDDVLSRSPQRDPETYRILGAAFEAQRELGTGFLEPVYQEALAIELNLCGIPFEREKPIPVFYKGRQLGHPYRPDFLVAGRVVVELKALDAISNREVAEVLNYLRAARLEKALLLNFGTTQLQFRRLVRQQVTKNQDFSA